MKHIVMIGTAHEFQTVGNSWEVQFSEMLASIVSSCDIEIILEEWNENRGTAIGSTLATPQLRWESVGTPSLPEYDTTKAGYINFDPFQPVHLMFRKYAFEVQEKREQFMVARVTDFMKDCQKGLLVVGMNHMHSGMAKLRSAGFDVEGGSWLRLECPRCYELNKLRVERDTEVTVEDDHDSVSTS